MKSLYERSVEPAATVVSNGMVITHETNLSIPFNSLIPASLTVTIYDPHLQNTLLPAYSLKMERVEMMLLTGNDAGGYFGWPITDLTIYAGRNGGIPFGDRTIGSLL